MSVIRVTERTIESQSGRKQSKPPPGLEYSFDGQRVFFVEFDSVNPANAIIAETASGPPFGQIPAMGDLFPGDNLRGVVSISPKAHSDNPLLYVVTVGYSSNSPVVGGTNGADGNPLNAPAEISWENEESKEPLSKDGDGNPILNSAGDSFDPPPEFEIDDPVLVITRNQVSYSESLAIQYANAVNTDAFHGGQPGEAKMKPITASKQTSNQITFWRVSYRIVFRQNWVDGTSGWTRLILDEGLRAIDVTSGKLVNIKDDDGNRITSPWRLDNGARLPTGGTPSFIKIPPYKKLPFNVFGLP